MKAERPMIWAPLAEQDLEEILLYLEKSWEPKICQNFITSLEKDLIRIAENPQQFPLINPELKIRKCVLSKHNNLYYTQADEIIFILRIYDNRKSPQNLTFQ